MTHAFLNTLHSLTMVFFSHYVKNIIDTDQATYTKWFYRNDKHGGTVATQSTLLKDSCLIVNALPNIHPIIYHFIRIHSYLYIQPDHSTLSTNGCHNRKRLSPSHD